MEYFLLKKLNFKVKEKVMAIAVAYARYSSDKQQESSITVQLAAIRNFCKANNIYLSYEYIDEAQTGTSANRKSFQQMVKDAEERKFQMVIVHRMDRFGRNVDDARYYKKHFRKYGIKVVSAIEGFNDTPEGEFFELMSMGMAELYSKKLSREATAGKIANAKECKVHGGIPLLGYMVKNKHYVVDENEAKAVKIIFNMVLEGHGYTHIRDYLNEHGYRRSDGSKYTSHFYDILRNRKYLGEYIYNRLEKRVGGSRNSKVVRAESEIIRISGGMPQLIDEDTFNKVQQIMDARKCKELIMPRKNRKYLLSGLLRCVNCGKAVCGGKETVRSDIPRTVYKCNGKGKDCNTKPIVTEYLDDYIHSLLTEGLFSPKNRQALIDLVEYAYLSGYDKLREEKEKLHQYLVQLNKQLIELGENNKDLMDVPYELTDKYRQVLADTDKAQEQLADLTEQLQSYPLFNPFVVKARAQGFYEVLAKKDFTSTQMLYHNLIRVIYVGNDEVEVMLNLHKLMDVLTPLPLTIKEKRDNIAHKYKTSRVKLDINSLNLAV